MNEYRYKMTRLIWVSFTIIMTVFLIGVFDSNNAMQDDKVIAALAILGATAVLGTSAIWSGATESDEERESSKKKRETQRMERLMQLMEDDDIVELETMLKSRELDRLRQNGQ